MKPDLTRRAAISRLAGVAAIPSIDIDEFTALARQASLKYFGAIRYGGQASAIAAGEAASHVGDLFSVDDGLGILAYREKTNAGSIEIARTVTSEALESPSGLSLLGHKFPYLGAAKRQLNDILNLRQGLTPEDMTTSPCGASDKSLVQDDTVAVRRWIESGAENLFIPPGRFYGVNEELISALNGRHIIGGGRCGLVALDQMRGKALLQINGNDTTLASFSVYNPLLNGSPKGPKTFGILINANKVSAVQLYVEDFEECIAVDAGGEYMESSFVFCEGRIFGQGGGPSDLTSDIGEDRGGFITVWGAISRVIGCGARPRMGTDARNGFFLENLDNFGGDYTSPDSSSVGIVIGNWCVPSKDNTGRVRRAFSLEGFKGGLIGYNFARGATWHEFQMPNTCNYSIIGSNIGISDISLEDKTGAAWSPVRAVFMNYIGANSETRGLSIDGNIAVCKTAAKHGFAIQGVGGTAFSVSVTGGKVLGEFEGHSTFSGLIGLDIVGGISVESMDIRGKFTNGMKFLNVDRLNVKNNYIEGSVQFAVTAEHGTKYISISNNHFKSTELGVQFVNFFKCNIFDNLFEGVLGNEMVFGGVNGLAIIKSNTDADGNGKIVDFGKNQIHLIDENPGFNYDRRVQINLLADLNSFVNIWGKHGGKQIVSDDNAIWVAGGDEPNSPWLKVGTKISINPN